MLTLSSQSIKNSFCFQSPRELSTIERHNEREIIRLIFFSSFQIYLFELHSLTCATYREFDFEKKV